MYRGPLIQVLLWQMYRGATGSGTKRTNKQDMDSSAEGDMCN